MAKNSSHVQTGSGQATEVISQEYEGESKVHLEEAVQSATSDSGNVQLF